MAEIDRLVELKKSFRRLLTYYPYYKEHWDIEDGCNAVKEFFRNFSLYFNSCDSSRSVEDMLLGSKNVVWRQFMICFALVYMAHLKSCVNTGDDRIKAGARASKFLWDEWGEDHFTYYTNIPCRFDEWGRLDIRGNELLSLLHSQIVDEHSTLKQREVASLYRYLYKEVGTFKKSVDRLVECGMLTDCEFHFPFI